MSVETVLVLAALVLAYSLVSRRLESTPFSGPLLFTAAGLLAGRAAGLELPMDPEVLRVLAEATLVFVLFTDAARMDLGALRREIRLPMRLLGIGLPLCIVAGTAAGVGLLPELGLWEAALLAAVLAPTDAALGQAVVSDPRLPVRVRQTINVESGLNDGIALPAVTILLTACMARQSAEDPSRWVSFVGLQLIGGAVAGVAVGWLAGWLVEVAVGRRLMTRPFRQIAVLAAAIVCYAAADALHGNGFIAAFVGGLSFGAVTRNDQLQELTEEEGQLLVLITFFLFGAVLLPPALTRADLPSLLYALLSLTLVRMVPVALAALGTRLDLGTVAFFGWFGPRGLASILFALLVVGESGLLEAARIVDVVYVTVLASVILHGVTAVPFTARLAHRLETLAQRRSASGQIGPVEHESCAELPLRWSGRTPSEPASERGR